MSDYAMLPEWELDSVYSSTSDPRFVTDSEKVQELNQEMQRLSVAFDPFDESALKHGLLLARELKALLLNLEHYLKALLSIDYNNPEARKALGFLNLQKAQAEVGFIPFKRAIAHGDKSILKTLDSDLDLEGMRFYFHKLRREGAILDLTEAEEAMVSTLRADGHDAWENLYSSVASNLKVTVHKESNAETLGLSQALSLLMHADANLRKSAWLGVQTVWTQNQEVAAAIANSLAGWRLALAEKRSKKQPVDFLVEPLMTNNIERSTLNALMEACEEHKATVQEGGRFMARHLNKPGLQLDPWDLLAPFPGQQKSQYYSFSEGIKMIKEALGAVNGELADFVQMAVDRSWIDGRVLPTKGVGAYCTHFPQVKEPRIFMTYAGSMYDIKTLAHELGHAYHYWLVRDLSVEEQQYPMTLAETASVFAENAFISYFLDQAKTEDERNAYLWDYHSTALAFLINIPARFEYEKNFYTQRSGALLTADELRELTRKAWEKWYGSLMTEYDSMYWAHKVHFSFSHLSFYNFPYVFGYLFSGRLFAEFKSHGPEFFQTYKAILKDTGRLSAEDLAKVHLGVDITQKDFWSETIRATFKTSAHSTVLNH